MSGSPTDDTRKTDQSVASPDGGAPVVSRRRFARRLLKFAIVAIVAVAAMVASLPWWLPTGWIRGRLTSTLSDILNTPVRIGRVAVGWREGVVVEDIDLLETESKDSQLLSIGRIRCGLTPLRWLSGAGLDRLELDSPSFFLKIDANGRLSIPLAEPVSGATATDPGIGQLSLGEATCPIIIRNGRLVLRSAHHSTSPTIRLGDLQVVPDAATGQLSIEFLDGVFVRDEGATGIDGRWNGTASIAQQVATTSPPGIAGTAQFQCDGVKLSALPTELLPALRGITLDGSLSGKLSITATESLTQTVSLAATIKGLVIDGNERERHEFATCTLLVSGVWDATRESVRIDELDVAVPGIYIHGVVPVGSNESHVLRWSARSDSLLDAHLEVGIQDLASLLREWPAIEPSRRLALSGGATIAVDAVIGNAGDELTVDLRGDRFAVSVDGINRLSENSETHLTLDATLDRQTLSWSLSNFSLNTDWLNLKASASHEQQMRDDSASTLPLDEAVIVALRKFVSAPWRSNLEVNVSVASGEEFTRRFPEIKSLVESQGNGYLDWSGAAAINLTAQRADHRLSLNGKIDFDAASEFRFGELIHKPARQPLQLSINGDWDLQSGLPVGTWRGSGTCQRLGLNWTITDAQASIHYWPQAWRLLLDDPAAAREDRPPAFESFDAGFTAEWKTTNLADLAQVCPLIADVAVAGRSLSETQISGGMSGSLCSSVQGGFTGGEFLLRECSAIIQADLTESAWRIPDILDKRVGQESLLDLDYSYSPSSPRSTHLVHLSLNQAGAVIQFDASNGGAFSDATLSLDVLDTNALRTGIPVTAEWIDRAQLQGEFSGSCEVRRTPAGESVALNLIADDASFALCAAPVSNPGTGPLSDAVMLSKPVGTPLNVNWRMRHDSVTSGDTTDRIASWRIQPGSIQFDRNELHITGGRVDWRNLSAPTASTTDIVGMSGGWQLHALDLSGNATVDFATARESSIPAIRQAAIENDLNGFSQLNWQIGLSSNRIDLAASAQCDDMSIDMSSLGARRSAGTPMRMAVDASVHQIDSLGAILSGQRISADTARPVLELRSGELRGDHWILSARGRSQLEMTAAGLTPAGTVWDFIEAEFVASDISEVTQLFPDAGIEARGRVRLDGRIVGSGDGWELRRGRLAASELKGTFQLQDTPPVPFSADGILRHRNSEWFADGFALTFGVNDIHMDGHVHRATDGTGGLSGELAVIGKRADVGELEALAYRVMNQLERGGLRRSASGDSTDAAALPSSGLTGIAPIWRTAAAASDLHILIQFHEAIIPRIGRAGPFVTHELMLTPSCARGMIDLPFHCAVDGGVVDGNYAVTLDEANPYFDLTYVARDMIAADNTRPLVEAFFPGLTVEGDITLIDATHQRLFDMPGVPNAPVGVGGMILGKGTVVGRAAPLAVTRLFPGLNLTRFDFDRMENRFEKSIDGRMENHMVFIGPQYHMYVDGVTFGDGRIRYEVGVDLFANVYPTLSRRNQGRIALFIKTGRNMPDGTVVDETVSYLRPDQILARIVSDNLITQAYTAIRAQFEDKNASD